MTGNLTVEVDGQVADVVLNRPEKHNALDLALFEALSETGAKLAADRSLRAVVLRGAGANFCAGIDVSVFARGEFDPASLQPLQGSPANLYQNAAYVWRRLPVPVIAALNGTVFGAGLQIALAADIRIASEDARFSIMESKWGLIPDMGLSTTLPALVGYDRAAELTWTGRVVDAAEAVRAGLVTALDQTPAAAAAELARTIAARSPDAVRAAKALLVKSYADRDAALLRREAELQLAVMRAPNQREAVAANLEQRSPEFGDSTI